MTSGSVVRRHDDRFLEREMTRGELTFRERPQHGIFLPAAGFDPIGATIGLGELLRPRTPWVEPAPDGGSIGDGTSPSSTICCFCFARRGSAIGTADSKRAGVGMSRLAIQGIAVGDLGDLAQVHHGDPVGDVLDHRQVVRDEQVRQVELALQIRQQVQDLRLHRHVERRDTARRRRSAAVAGRAPGRRRSADADRRRTRAGSGCSARGSDPTSSMSSCTVALRLFRSTVPCSWNGSLTIEPTVLRGFSEAYGSWNTICMSRRSSRSSPPFRWVMSLPSNSIVPLGGFVQAHDDAREGGLAAPGLPHQAHGLARGRPPGRRHRRHARHRCASGSGRRA